MNLKDKLILKEVVFYYLLSLVLIWLFTFLGSYLSFINNVVFFLVAVIFITFPVIVARKKNIELEEFGLKEDKIVADILIGIGIGLLIFPPFWIGSYIYWNKILGMNISFHLTLPPNLLNIIVTNIFLVAFPEEFFYRGYIQKRISELLKYKLKGYKVIIISVLISSTLFSIGHLVTIPNVARLAVFFPSIIFGLLRQWRKSIFSAIVFHSFCNVFMDTLQLSYGLISPEVFM